MQNPKIKNLAILNNLIWFAMAGAQFTLLPLHLVSDQFHFSSFEIGSCFAYSSIVSFIASQPIAYLSDKFGRLRTLLIGTSLVSGSILFIPMTESLTHLLINLTPLSIGMTALSASTPALITDLTKTEQRAQGMSLFRTSSDLGFLFGATFSGLVATYSSLGTAFVMDGGIILSGMMWFMLQNRLSKKVTEQKKSNKKE
jgi:MFS family permease